MCQMISDFKKRLVPMWALCCTALLWDVPKSVKVIHSLYRFVGTYDLTRKKWRKFGTMNVFYELYTFFLSWTFLDM